MPRRLEADEITKKESLLGFSIIIVTAVVVMAIVYMQQGLNIYTLLIPLVTVGAMFFGYETFKAFLRMVGRELEMGKSQVEDEKAKKMLMLVCPKCKAKNPADAARCFNCGEKL